MEGMQEGGNWLHVVVICFTVSQSVERTASPSPLQVGFYLQSPARWSQSKLVISPQGASRKSPIPIVLLPSSLRKDDK